MKPSNDNLSRRVGRVYFPAGLVNALGRGRGRLIGLALAPACAGLVLASSGCKNEPVKAPDADAAATVEAAHAAAGADAAATATVQPATTPAEPAAPIAMPPPGPNPTLPLTEHSGSITGPISWVVAESVGAQPASPLIVLLHGRGDNPESFVRLAWRLADRLRTPVRFVAARAPHPIGLAQGRQWFDPRDGGPEASLVARLADFDAFLQRLKETYPDAPPPVVVGFSQGAMMALHLALGRPTAITAAASLSGGLVAAAAAASDGGQAPKTRPPVFIAAGAKDTIVPAERSWQAAVTLTDGGFVVTRYPFAGSHRIDDDELDALGAWLRPIIAPPAAP